MLARRYSIVPGFGLTFGYTTLYLSLVVLVPLAALAAGVLEMSWGEFLAAAANGRVMAAYRLTVLCSLGAAAVNAAFGFVVAWCLARYRFWGRGVLNALIDLPFALPTAVSGIVLTTLYARHGWIGRPLKSIGIDVAYTPLGIVLALVFIGLPFVVRLVEPALEEMDAELEQAAESLGASRWETFRRVILPAVAPSLGTGFALAFARALGEYGSVIFIAGNMPMKTEIAPLLIVAKLEQFDYAGAAAIAVVLLVVSFGLLLGINWAQWRWSSRYGSQR